MRLILVNYKSGVGKIFMNNYFIDSNICVYAFDKSDVFKQQVAFNLLENKPFVSSQVIIETYNACYKKLKIEVHACESIVLHLCNITAIVEINDQIFRNAIIFKKKYQFSFLDAIIVSSAYSTGTSILYSEDMQNNLVIENNLTIINPFA